MSVKEVVMDDNHKDDHVEDEIQACFDRKSPKSFFTYAGAGSGKTYSLVNTLNFIDVLKEVSNTGLLNLSERMLRLVSNSEDEQDVQVIALEQALSVPVSEMRSYCLYTEGHSSFSTYQGVKGLEYPRVMVIMDDTEAEGSLFSYEKLFGAKELSDTDLENERQGKDSSISRTRRLFYVACTRAKESLAIVAYTQDKESVKQTVIQNKWFTECEVEFI